MPRGMTLITAVLLGLVASSGIAAYIVFPPRENGWHVIAWPFPRDGWPAGRAWRCPATSCGAEMEVYVRPKIGFCNCDSGVADDDEVDRVADLDLIAPHFRALTPGVVVRITGMSGRIRQYDLNDGSHRQAVAVVVSHKCDLMVAAGQGNGGAAAVRQHALQFIESKEASDWIKSAMNVGP
jgi:hypothetical protein